MLDTEWLHVAPYHWHDTVLATPPLRLDLTRLPPHLTLRDIVAVALSMGMTVRFEMENTP